MSDFSLEVPPYPKELGDAVTEEPVKGYAELSNYPYVEYWYCFAEQHPGLFKAMNTPLPAGGFMESSSSQLSP
jgi:hypothetical protein